MKACKQKLDLAMARACMRQCELIVKFQIPSATVKNVFAGRNVTPATLGRIAKALNVDITDIIEEVTV